MPWNGSGTFSLNQNFPADRDAGAPDHFIGADKMDDELQNLKGGLENCLTRDGQTAPSANTPWNGMQITGLGDATNATDALNRQSGDARYLLRGGDTLTGNITLTTTGFDFALADGDGNFTNYLWRDDSANVLYLGSNVAVPTLRENLNANGFIVYGAAAPTQSSHVGDRGYNDARYLLESNNLSDLPNVATARTNLGLGSIATNNSISNANWVGQDLAVGNGGTGASTQADARSNLGIGSMATRAYTASTAAPSGGANGDVWFRYQ